MILIIKYITMSVRNWKKKEKATYEIQSLCHIVNMKLYLWFPKISTESVLYIEITELLFLIEIILFRNFVHVRPFKLRSFLKPLRKRKWRCMILGVQ